MFDPRGAAAEEAFGVAADLPDWLCGGAGSVLAALAEAPGSPGALAVLAATDPAHLSLAERIDLVRAWERQLAWVSAGQLPAIAALEDPGADEPPRSGPAAASVPDTCREELAAALHLSGAAAQARLDLARDLGGRLGATAAALRTGVLSAQKAGIIAKTVRPLDDAHAATVETAVLPAAATQTPAELHRALAHAILMADPAGAAQRTADAVAGRRVISNPLPDGMGGIWAELAAADVQTVMTGLDADAVKIRMALRTAGTTTADIPGVAARRADALLGWARRALAEPDLPTVADRRPNVQVTVSLGTLLGLDDQPGELAGYGPIDADTARRIAADGTWRRLITDPVSGALLDYGRTVYQPPADLREFVLARDPACRFVGCLRPARRCQLDHIVERQHGGRTAADNLQPECVRHHICKTVGGWTVTRAEDGVVTWTSPAGRTYSDPAPRIALPQSRAGPPEGTRGGGTTAAAAGAKDAEGISGSRDADRRGEPGGSPDNGSRPPPGRPPPE